MAKFIVNLPRPKFRLHFPVPLIYRRIWLSFIFQTWLFVVLFVLIVMFDGLVGWTSFSRAPRVAGFVAIIRVNYK